MGGAGAGVLAPLRWICLDVDGGGRQCPRHAPTAVSESHGTWPALVRAYVGSASRWPEMQSQAKRNGCGVILYLGAFHTPMPVPKRGGCNVFTLLSTGRWLGYPKELRNTFSVFPSVGERMGLLWCTGHAALPFKSVPSFSPGCCYVGHVLRVVSALGGLNGAVANAVHARAS